MERRRVYFKDFVKVLSHFRPINKNKPHEWNSREAKLKCEKGIFHIKFLSFQSPSRCMIWTRAELLQKMNSRTFCRFSSWIQSFWQSSLWSFGVDHNCFRWWLVRTFQKIKWHLLLTEQWEKLTETETAASPSPNSARLIICIHNENNLTIPGYGPEWYRSENVFPLPLINLYI